MIEQEKAGWAEQKIIEAAGVRMIDATPEIIRLARFAGERFYYIDRAAEWLMTALKK